MASVPATQTAAVLHKEYGQSYVIEKQWPVRPPQAEEVVVKLEASGICFGDLHARDGGPPAPEIAVRPLVGGHEGVGYVVAVGGSAGSFKTGERVGLGWRRSVCEDCCFCNDGEDNNCLRQVPNGFMADGTFQEYVTIPFKALVRVPSSSIPPAQLAPLLCGGATALAAMRRAKAPRGSWMAVAGAAGGVGHLVIQYAKHEGLKVIGIDRKSKETFCTELGVDKFVSFEDKGMTEEILKITGGGVKSTIVVSGVTSAYTQAVSYSGPRGVIVAVGPAVASVHTGLMMQKDITLHAQCNGSQKLMAEALQLAEKGITAMVEVVDISQIEDALDRLKQGDVHGRLAIVYGK